MRHTTGSANSVNIVGQGLSDMYLGNCTRQKKGLADAHVIVTGTVIVSPAIKNQCYS